MLIISFQLNLRQTKDSSYAGNTVVFPRAYGRLPLYHTAVQLVKYMLRAARNGKVNLPVSRIEALQLSLIILRIAGYSTADP